jgi:hypothetical protein
MATAEMLKERNTPQLLCLQQSHKVLQQLQQSRKPCTVLFNALTCRPCNVPVRLWTAAAVTSSCSSPARLATCCCRLQQLQQSCKLQEQQLQQSCKLRKMLQQCCRLQQPQQLLQSCKTQQQLCMQQKQQVLRALPCFIGCAKPNKKHVNKSDAMMIVTEPNQGPMQAHAQKSITNQLEAQQGVSKCKVCRKAASVCVIDDAANHNVSPQEQQIT